MKNYTKIKISLIIGLFLCLCGCSTVKYVPMNSESKNNYIDSTRIHIIDSIRIIPIERYIDFVSDADTLHLETTLAVADAWIENNHIKGRIENKKGTEQHIRTTEKERIIKDTVYLKESVPVEVEKVVEVPPKSMKFFVGWFICSLVLLFGYTWKKLH